MKKIYKVLFFGAVLGMLGCLAAYLVLDQQSFGGDSASALAYEVKPGDELFLMRGDALSKVTQIVAVSSSLFEEKQILMKEEGNPKVLFFTNLRYDAFNQYNELVLKKFIESNPKLDFRVASSLSGVGKIMGLPSDPYAEMAKQTAKNAGSTTLEVGGYIAVFGFIIIFMAAMQAKTLSNGPQKTNPNDIKDDLDDLVGMEDIIAEVLQIEEMFKNRKLFGEFGVEKANNLMLTGPAGCGKTMLTRCLAKRLNLPLYYGSGASLESGFVSGGSKTLQRLFKAANKHKQGAIVFLDEAEDLLKARNLPDRRRHENDTSNALLAILDGVNSKTSKVICVVASNFNEQSAPMDEAMMRRFPHKINFRLPNERERLELLRRLLAKRDPSKLSGDIELSHLAKISSGMSPAVLDTLVNRASLIAIHDGEIINQDRLIRAFERVAVGLTDRATTAGMEEDRRIISTHEAGHFILKLHHTLEQIAGDLPALPEALDTIKISTEAVSQHNALGFVLSKNRDKPLSSREEYERTLMELYGGVANEEITFGEASVTAGARDDIAKATKLLAMMFNEVGYYSKSKLNLKALAETGISVGRGRLEEIRDLSEELYDRTMAVLARYRPLTQAISERLMSDYVITHPELVDMVSQYFAENDDLLRSYRPWGVTATA